MFHVVGCQVIPILQDEDNRKGADVGSFPGRKGGRRFGCDGVGIVVASCVLVMAAL